MRGLSTFGLIGMPTTLLLLGIGLLFSLAYIYRVRSSKLLCVEVFVVGFLLRIFLVLGNANFAILESKVADERALELYQKYLLGINTVGSLSTNLYLLAKEQFAVQTLINAPFFALFGESVTTIIFTNSFFGAIVAPVASLMLYQSFNERVARRALILFSLYPALINFSMFGLRDPLIFFFMTVFAVSAMCISVGFARGFHTLTGFVNCLGMLLLRPELFYVVVALIGLLMTPRAFRLIRPEQRFIERVAVAVVFLSIGVVFAGAMVFLSVYVAAKQIGANTINPMDIAGERAVERFERAEETDFGGGSHLMSGDQYRNLSTGARVAIQTAGLVVLPFPWLIEGVAQLLAFFDSCYLMVLMFLALMYIRGHTRYKAVSGALLFAYCIALLGMGVIVSNAGNGFRMRFGAVPLCLLAGSFSQSIPLLKLRRD